MAPSFFCRLVVIVNVKTSNKIAGVNQTGTYLSIDGQQVSSGMGIDLYYGRTHVSRTGNEILNTTYKHHDWDNKYAQFKMTEAFEISLQYPTRDANFVQIKPANIKGNVTEIANSDIATKSLKDPWWIDQNGNQPNDFHNLSSSNVSVFLNQGWPGWNPPYYSVQAASQQDINLGGSIGTRRFYFQNWSLSNASLQYPSSLESGVVFTDANATVTANYKGQLLSNNSTGFSSNSQRKFISDNYGTKHLVYDSQGSVWYSKSTDNGANWSQDVKLNDDGTQAKGATTAYSVGDGYLYVVYQSDVDASGWPTPSFILSKYFNGTLRWKETVCNLSSYIFPKTMLGKKAPMKSGESRGENK